MARAVLAYGGLINNLLVRDYDQCIDWIENVARELDNKAVADLITILWNVWNSRNNRIFRGVEEEAKVTWERVATLSHDFQVYNLLEDPMLSRKVEEKVQRKPNQGMVKINFDAIVTGKNMCFGMVARDFDGFVLGGRIGILDKGVQIEGRRCRLWKKASLLPSQKTGIKWSWSLTVLALLIASTKGTLIDYVGLQHAGDP